MIVPMGIDADARREVHREIMLGSRLLNWFWFRW